MDASNEAFLLSIQDEIAAIVDLNVTDPWPRHQDHSGASIAVRAATLRRAGGAPRVTTAEDRALIKSLLLVDANVRHAEIVVRVSGRLDGRAHGGMADTIKRRLQRPDLFTDERLEPTVDAYRRVLTKARLRNVLFGCGDADSLAEDILLGSGVMRELLRAEYFGMAWAEVQRLSPVLQRRPVRFTDLHREIRQARALRDRLREEAEVSWIDPRSDHNVPDIATDENAG
jgi:hypothetical protein